MSSTFPNELDAMRAIEPSLRVGWSVPRARRDYTEDNRLIAIPALALLAGYRALLPRRVRAALHAGRFDAVMAHWRVVTPALVRAVAGGGRGAVRVDGGRRRAGGAPDGDGGPRDHHQRPASVWSTEPRHLPVRGPPGAADLN